MPLEQQVKAERVLEFNPEHPVFDKLRELFADENGKASIAKYAKLLYDQALLISGMPIDDPVDFSATVNELFAGQK